MFCKRGKLEVGLLLSGLEGHIYAHCIEQAYQMIHSSQIKKYCLIIKKRLNNRFSSIVIKIAYNTTIIIVVNFYSIQHQQICSSLNLSQSLLVDFQSYLYELS